MRGILAASALAVAFGFVGVAAYGQGAQPTGKARISPPPTASVPNASECIATAIELEIGTGGDDLRGGQNNLNVEIEFANHPVETAPNVNRGENWPNNSVHTVRIPLTPPVLVGQIQSIRLYHIADGGFNGGGAIGGGAIAGPAGLAAGIKTADNWDMAYLHALAEGKHGFWRLGNYGAYRFTGKDTNVTVPLSAGGTCAEPSSSPSDSSGPSLSDIGSGKTGSAGGKGGSGSRSGGTLLSGGSGSSGRPTEGSSGGGTGGQLLTGSNGSQPGSLGGNAIKNSDVIKMVEAGLPDSAIIASMRSRPGSFDLSNKARADLLAANEKNRARKMSAREMNGIWDAMIAKTTNGRGGDSADELNPQPYPPKNAPAASGSQPNSSALGGKSGPLAAKGPLAPPSKLLKAKLGPPKKGPTILNQAAASHAAALAAMLRSQRQGADQEAARISASLQSAGQSKISPGSSRTMSASGSSGSAPLSGRTTQNAQTGAATGTTGTSNPQQNSGMLSSRAGATAMQGSLPLACVQNPAMRIFSVSGKDGPVTFTTDPAGNFYTITGCSFGNPGPNAKVYIYYQNVFNEGFQIQEWNDNYIKLNLDPSLTGVGDQDNLTLVVQRADGQQADKPGFKFSAMRQTVHLRAFPQQYFSLDKLTLTDVSDLRSGFASPADPGSSFPNMTAEVSWYDPDLQPVPDKGFVTQKNTPPSGTDIYDFSHLAPGFEFSSASVSAPDPAAFCSAGSGKLVAASGTFGGQLNGSQLWITWQGWNCNFGPSCNFLGCTDYFGNPAMTDYGLDVWVEGPRGVDPWTGQPTKR